MGLSSLVLIGRRTGGAGLAATAVVKQIAGQCAHPAKAGAVHNQPAVPRLCDQPRPFKMGEVERQRRWHQAEAIGDFAGGKPVRFELDKQPEDRESVFLRERGKRSDSFLASIK